MNLATSFYITAQPVKRARIYPMKYEWGEIDTARKLPEAAARSKTQVFVETSHFWQGRVEDGWSWASSAAPQCFKGSGASVKGDVAGA